MYSYKNHFNNVFNIEAVFIENDKSYVLVYMFVLKFETVYSGYLIKES